MLRRLLGLEPGPNAAIVQALYGEIVAAARAPAFYADMGAPDTPLGRFEMIALHMVLALERLTCEGEAGRGIAQELTDDFFTDVEHSLRELGIGDMGVPKRMKKLAKMFYGRAQSYRTAITANDAAALAAALHRNVRPDLTEWPEAAMLAGYALTASAALAAQPSDAVLSGRLGFLEPAPVYAAISKQAAP